MFKTTVAQALKGLEKSLRDLADAEAHHTANAEKHGDTAEALLTARMEALNDAENESVLAVRAARVRSKLADLIG